MLSVHGKHDIALTIAIGILGQLSDGLRRLTHLYEGGDQIALSLDEFHSICIKLGGGNFLSDDNTLSASQFEAMIRQHLAVFVQRQLAFGSLELLLNMLHLLTLACCIMYCCKHHYSIPCVCV